MTQPVFVDEPVDLSRAEYVEITITRPGVCPHGSGLDVSRSSRRQNRRKGQPYFFSIIGRERERLDHMRSPLVRQSISRLHSARCLAAP
jgi:hypothetical protein